MLVTLKSKRPIRPLSANSGLPIIGHWFEYKRTTSERPAG